LGGKFIASNVVLHEGVLKTASYIVNTKDTLQRFLIEDPNIDIDTLSIRVQRSVTDTEGFDQIWSKSTDINVLNGDSRVFFTQEAENGKWEIYFGDGIVGKNLDNGNLIQMVYLSTNGESGNGIGSTDSEQSRVFTSSNPEFLVDVIKDSKGIPQASYGGTEPESTESVKFYAPKNYQAQDRAVTSEDYSSILAKEYSSRSESFLVWGGEENDPPQYGKVFISIKPKNASRLSITEKQAITKTVLGERNLVTVTPEIVDPDLTYINLSTKVFYDPQLTAVSPDVLVSKITAKIVEYGNTFLDQFGKNFRQSKFNTFIDSLDSSINSSNTVIKLEKRIEPQFERTLPYTIKFDNSIFHPIDGYPSILTSSSFYYRDITSTAVNKPSVVAYLDDDGYGNVRIYKKVNEEKIYLVNRAGTINYNTGLVQLKSFSPLSIPEENNSVEIKIIVVPQSGDVLVRRNQVLLINDREIDLVIVPEKTVIDRNSSDVGFPFRIN
jgi:hypothetical protein